jgi:tetratricopeptide (TPR) repeat protein
LALACGLNLLVTGTSQHAGPGGTREPAPLSVALYLRSVYSAATWCAVLLLLLFAVGCAGFSRRLQPDDVVLARQIAQRGMDAVDAGNWQKAEECFAQAVDVCPVDERVQARYADALWHRGTRKEALEHLQEAVRLSGGEPELVVRLGEMYLATGDLQEASKLADRVILSGRQLASAYRLRGDVRERQGKSDDALADYHRALGMQPQYPEVHLAIAAVYYRQDRPQRALSTLQALAGSYTSGEEPVELLYWQGLACKALGRPEQAVMHLSHAEERGLQTADLLYNLAEARQLAGDPAAAQLTLQRALELEPNHPDAARVAQALQQLPHVASRQEREW